MRVAIVVVVLVVDVARADAPVGVTEYDEDVRDPDAEPLRMRFESGVTVRPESFDVAGVRIPLSSRIALELGSDWRSVAPHDQRDGDLVQWWRSGVNLRVDLGVAQLTVFRGRGHHENEVGIGDYDFYGLDLTATRKLSDGITGYASLQLARRDWHDIPPPGEYDATTVMFVLGLRW